MNEMINADFITLLESYPSTDQEEIFDDAARRIRNLEAELQAWKSCANILSQIMLDNQDVFKRLKER